jgi:hypothetical protein
MKDPQSGPQLLSNLYFKRLMDLEKIRDYGTLLPS